MAMVYVVADWQLASDRQAAYYFNQRAVKVLGRLEGPEAQQWRLQAEAIAAVLGPKGANAKGVVAQVALEGPLVEHVKSV